MSAYFLIREAGRLLREAKPIKAAIVPGRVDGEFLSALVEQIFSFYSTIPPFYNESAPEPLKISATWATLLRLRRPQQLRSISDLDFGSYQSLLENLFQSELIQGLWNYGSRVERGIAPDFLRELKSLQVETGLELQDMCVGEPVPSAWGLPVQSRYPHVISHVAPSHCRQALHVIRALRSGAIPETISRPTVVDLGSGFGGMVHFLMNLWPVPSDLVLLDIPLNLTTAYAYLRIANPKANVVLVSTLRQLEALSVERSSLLGHRIILVPSILSGDVARLFPANILHNAQSLSEMSRETIEFYLETLVVSATRVVIDSNVADSFETLNSGHLEVPSGTISEVLSRMGLLLLSRNIRDTGSRYVVSTHVRL